MANACSKCGHMKGSAASRGCPCPCHGSVRNVVIKTDGTVIPYPPASGHHYRLEELKAAIGGGYIEIVKTGDGRAIVLDEEDKLKGFSRNEIATDLYPFGGLDPIVGDVLVCEFWRID